MANHSHPRLSQILLAQTQFQQQPKSTESIHNQFQQLSQRGSHIKLSVLLCEYFEGVRLWFRYKVRVVGFYGLGVGFYGLGVGLGF